MSKDSLYTAGKKGYFNYITGFIIGVVVAAAFIAVFALVMYFAGAAAEYAPVFATLSVAVGSFAAAFFTARRQGNRGWLAGAIIGGITFILITLISLIINSGGGFVIFFRVKSIFLPGQVPLFGLPFYYFVL